jgi:hypothetical protein
MIPHTVSYREGAMASVDVDPFHLPEPRRVPLLARVLGPAGLIALGLVLWGTLTREVWSADADATADLDRGPVAVEADACKPR